MLFHCLVFDFMTSIQRFFTPVIVALFLIFCLGTFLRFNNIANNPPALNWDEVAFAVNAHMINETGKDEYGRTFPLYFQSLDDYKLPVYVYLTALSEKIFGYNNFAVRFPSALFGSLSIIAFFLLCRILFKPQSIALIATLLFAILPWHIQFSRMAAEATVGLFFFLLGLLFFLESMQKKRWILLVSFFFFALAQYTYLPFRYAIPLLGIVLIFLYRKTLFKKNIFVIIACILALGVSGLLLFDSYSNRNTSRVSGIAAIDSYTKLYQQDLKQQNYDGSLGINLSRRVFHDSHLFSSFEIATSNYLGHFSPGFLFFEAEQPRHYTPMIGLLYVWFLPFLLVGTYFLFRENKNSIIVTISLLLITPIPLAFAFDSPNAIRAIALVLPFCILTAIGIRILGTLIRKRHRSFFFVYVFITGSIATLGLVHFYHQNTIHLPHERSQEWLFGRKEMTEYILQNQKNYDKIIVSPELEWPNIFFLYYSHYDPQKYLAQGGTRGGSWSAENNKIDNIIFKSFKFPFDTRGQKILLIGAPNEFPKETRPLKQINYLDGKPAIYLIKITPPPTN